MPAAKKRKSGDAKPAKKGSAKEKAAKSKPTTGAKKANAKKATSEPLDPQEEELKKLRSLATACGARKVWGNEFKKHGLDTPSSQIKHMKDMLRELGLAKFTLSAAKELGAKRALEKEAAELGMYGGMPVDVEEGGRGARRRSVAARPVQSVEEVSSEEETPREDDSDDSDDEQRRADEEAEVRKEEKKFANRTARNVAAFTGALGLGGGEKKKPKKKSKKEESPEVVEDEEEEDSESEYSEDSDDAPAKKSRMKKGKKNASESSSEDFSD